jgi:transcriptional regulator with XRE-family HTH domain
MTFGNNVRWRRKRLHITQAQLAGMIRVHGRHPSPAYISRIEHGSIDPRLSTIKSLARALDVKPWYLVADISENTEFWDAYLALSPAAKRDIQRLARRFAEWH